MTAQPHPSQFEPSKAEIEPDPEANPEARAARRIAVAHRLVEMGLELAEAAQRLALARMERQIAAAEAGEVEAAETPASRRSDPVADAERMARMVRLSLALAARLDGDEPARRARARAEAKDRREAEKDAQWQAIGARESARIDEMERREDIIAEVMTGALTADGADRETIDERIHEAFERLSEGEWEYDLLDRPVGALAAQLCRDIGLEPDWSVWADTDWAVEEAATNAPGSPYARGGVGGDGSDRPPDADDSTDLAEPAGGSP